jgi:P pilus assembly chaperone PapD
MNKLRLYPMLAAAAALIVPTSPASAELVISQLIVELAPSARTADVLVFNDSAERSYISIEPREVLYPGTPEERRIAKPDPRELGLLLSSTRLILEPQQKRLLRLAATSIPDEKERVYRVIVKPVVGDLDSATSGLKLLVGYEMLVMVRPAKVSPVNIEPRRTNGTLTLTNRGSSSVELMDGRRCLAGKSDCSPLPAKRLYAGASWTQPVPSGGRVEYRVLSNGKNQLLNF